MKQGVLFLAVLLILPFSAQAAIPALYTNDNLFTAEHDQPVSLFQDGLGGFYGHTLTGKLYTQKPIANSYGIRLQKFVIDDAWFYMSDRGMIAADSDIVALSIYFTRA